MELRPSTTSLALAEDFAIARGSRTTQEVVRVELEHDGLVGRGEAAPIYYRGETVRSALAFLRDEAPARRAAETTRSTSRRSARRWRGGAEAAARAALDAALHDWVGQAARRAPLAPARADPRCPPTSYTIGIDSAGGHARPRPPRARVTRCSR